MKVVKLRGGFHNRPNAITLHIDDKALFKAQKLDCYYVDLLYLSPIQRKRLKKHFCGFTDCSCAIPTACYLTNGKNNFDNFKLYP